MYVPNVVTETFCEIFSLPKIEFYTILDTFHEKPLNKQQKALQREAFINSCNSTIQLLEFEGHFHDVSPPNIAAEEEGVCEIIRILLTSN